jgi:hypothetical protein
MADREHRPVDLIDRGCDRADEYGRFTIIKSWPASAPDPYPALLLDATGSTDDGVSAAALSG